MQLVLAIALLGDSGSAGLTRALVFVLMALFVSALGRSWEVAGIEAQISARAPELPIQ